MLPIVTIVGRPNVGKSMLFNRLTKTKDALVVDLPGTTRDRKYGEGHVGSKRYVVVDTGGVGIEEDDIDFAMSKQSWAGVLEGDVILFVVDGKSGPIAADMQLAKKLRQLKKPVLLVVNKTDSIEPTLAVAEFFKFGLGTPMPISALANRGIKQLADKLCESFPVQPEDDDALNQHAGIKVAIVGRPNVGKSTLVNYILQEDRVVVFDTEGTTRDSIYIPFEHNGKQYTLIDTAGVRQRSKIKNTVEKFSIIKTLQAIEGSNVTILVVDGQQGITDQDLTLAGFIIEAGKGLVVAFNKVDLLSKYDLDNITKELAYRFAFADFAEKHFISALQGSKVKGLFPAILRAYNSATKKITTPMLTRLLIKIVEQHMPPMVGPHRIKLRYAHVGGYNPPRIVIHGNQTSKIPGSYKRYLENAFRKELKIVGTPIFFEFKSSVNPYKDK